MPRKSASSHRTKSSKRNTKHQSKDKKMKLKNKQQFADDQEQINSMQNMPKIFGITYEIKNKKRSEDEKKLILNIWNLKYLKWRKML